LGAKVKKKNDGGREDRSADLGLRVSGEQSRVARKEVWRRGAEGTVVALLGVQRKGKVDYGLAKVCDKKAKRERK